MMEQDEFERLEVALGRRFVPPLPRGLDARIVAAAQDMPQSGGVFDGGLRLWGGILSGVLEEMRGAMQMPQPAFVLAAFLVLGISLGVYSDAFDMSGGLTDVDLSGFMAIDDQFVAAEFWEAGAL